MQAALETRNYQKEKNKHRQNDPKKVGRGQRLEAKSTDWRSPVFIELKVDERDFYALYAMVFAPHLVSVQRQWKDPSISFSISTAQYINWGLHFPPTPRALASSTLALYCPPRKLQTTPLRKLGSNSSHRPNQYLGPYHSVWKDSWLTLRQGYLMLLTWIGILGSIPPYPRTLLASFTYS